MSRKLSGQQVIERMNMFGIEYIRKFADKNWFGNDSQFNRTIFVFKFPKREGGIIVRGPHTTGKREIHLCSVSNDSTLRQDHEHFYHSRRHEQIGNISLSVDYRNLFASPVIYLNKQIVSPTYEMVADVVLTQHHKDIQIMSYRFCQGEVPGGILWDAIQEATPDLSI